MAIRLLALVFALAVPGTAYAYIGPGLGVGAITAVLGIIGSIFLALFAAIYYPIKRALKRVFKRRRAASETGDVPAEKDAGSPSP